LPDQLAFTVYHSRVMTVFISRELPLDATFLLLLQAEGWQVAGQSLVQLSPLPFSALPAADWAFLSSQNAVRFFFQQMEKESLVWPDLRWAALGEATAKVLAAYAGSLDFVGSGDPKSTAAAFQRLAAGSTVLFPGARHSLQSVQRLLGDTMQGIHLEVYDNRPVADPAQRHESVLVFTSPLNAGAYFSRHSLQPGQQVVAIGATTTATLQKMGITTVITAAAPTEMALASAVLALTNLISS